MKRILFIGLLGLISSQSLLGQIRIRNVIPHDTPIPEKPDGLYGNAGIATLNGANEVILTISEPTFFADFAAYIWDPNGLRRVLAENDRMPILPAIPESINTGGIGTSFDDPRVTSISVVSGGPGRSYALQVRVKDGFAQGNAYLLGQGSDLGFYSESLLGVALETGETLGTVFPVPTGGGNFSRITISGLTRPIIPEGGPAPGIDGGTFANQASHRINWNGSGNVLALTTVNELGQPFRFLNALYRETVSRDLQLIAKVNDPYPDTSGLVDGGAFAAPSGGFIGRTMNSAGDVAFVTGVTPIESPTNSVDGLWSITATAEQPELLLRAGIPVAIEDNGQITFTDVFAPAIASNGDVFFYGQWQVESAFRNGIFRWERSTGVVSQVIANGDLVTADVIGASGSVVVNFTSSDFIISPNGQVAFKGRIALPGQSDRDALIVQRRGEPFFAAIVEGDGIEFTDGTAPIQPATITFSGSRNGMLNGPVVFSDNGRLIAAVTNTSGPQRDSVIAIDIDYTSPAPDAIVGAPAGTTQSWEKPEGFRKVFEREFQAAESSLATACDEQIEINAESLTGLNRRQLAVLRTLPAFSNLDVRVFVKKYLQARLSVLRAIDLAGFEQPELAGWLLETYRSGRLRFGRVRGGFASIHADGSALCGQEAITINSVPCGDLSIYDPDLLQLANTLMHEARHAFQEFPALPRIHTVTEQAIWARGRHENEIFTSCEEVKRLNFLIEAIEGRDSSAFARRILNQISAELTGSERDAAIAALLTRTRWLLRNAEETKRCRAQFVEVIDRFLQSARSFADADVMNRELIRLKWFRAQSQGEFGPIGIYTGGAERGPGGTLTGNPTVRQLDVTDGSEETFVPGDGVDPDFIWDGDYRDSDGTLYVAAGFRDATRIFAYQDIDGDDFWDKESETELVARADWQDGISLSYDDSTNSLRILVHGQQTVYELTSGDNAELRHFATLADVEDPVLGFFSEGGTIEASPMPENDPQTPDLISHTHDGVDQGSYARFTAQQLAAILDKAPVEGDTSVEVTGRPGDWVQACLNSRQMILPLGDAVLDEKGKAVIEIDDPLAAGDGVLAFTMDIGSLSTEIPAWKVDDLSPEIEILQPPSSDEPEVTLELRGIPNRQYAVESSGNLEFPPQTINTDSTTGYGVGYRVVGETSGIQFYRSRGN